MEIASVNTILYCENWKNTVVFYRDLLGLPITFSTEWFVEFSLLDSVRISVADESRATIKSGHGRGHTISIQVVDVFTTFDELKGKSLDPTAIKTCWGCDTTFIRDPEGNRLEFWSVQPAIDNTGKKQHQERNGL